MNVNGKQVSLNNVKTCQVDGWGLERQMLDRLGIANDLNLDAPALVPAGERASPLAASHHDGAGGRFRTHHNTGAPESFFPGREPGGGVRLGSWALSGDDACALDGQESQKRW